MTKDNLGQRQLVEVFGTKIDKKEQNIFIGWIMWDGNPCPRCRARFKIFLDSHYGITFQKEGRE